MAFLRRLTVALALAAACLATASSAWASTVTRIVRKAGGSGAYTTIQAAVNASTSPLAFDYVINVDSSTYSEQVTFTGRNMNNFRITVQSDPNLVSTRTTVIPPVASTAAFFVRNDSITINNIIITATNTVQYGIRMTAAYTQISSITINPNTKIWTAGISLSSSAFWADINYSSVAVGGAHGLRIEQSSGTTVSYSTFSSNKSNFAGLSVIEASSNTFLVVLASSNVSKGLEVEGTATADSTYNTFIRSSFTSAATTAGNSLGNYASWNTFDQVYFFNKNSQALYLNPTNNNNTIKRSTIAATVAAQQIFRMDGDYNTVEDSWITGQGTALSQIVTARFTTINRSTFTNSSANGMGMQIRGATSTFSGCYVQADIPVSVRGATGTVINTSTLYTTASSSVALRMWAYAQHLTLSSNTIKGGDAAAAVQLEYNDWFGDINIDSNAITVSAISAGVTDQGGIRVDKPKGNASVWITSNTFLPTLLAGRDTIALYMYGLAQGATVQGNNFYYRSPNNSNYTTPFYVQNTTGVTINHNRISNPGMVTGAASSFYGADVKDSHNFTFTYNDMHSTSPAIGTDILLQLNFTTVTLKNNVFLASSTAGTLYTLNCVASANGKQQCGINSDYNTFFSSSGGGNWSWANYGGVKQLAANWVSGKDANSVFTHPQWFSTDIGDEDFHPRSRQGRYRNGSWATDGTDSPTIDKGDPNDDKTLEPSPNGTAPNQGSYGGTDEASKTYVPRRKQVIVIH